METLRLSNYKCFEDTGTFTFKPINILVGANSSGKSSFLEFFPLLKQSIGVRKNGSLLWNSENGIDTQDFHNTVRDGKGDISFTFYMKSNFFTFAPLKNGDDAQINVVISQLESHINDFTNLTRDFYGTDYIKYLSVVFQGERIELSFNDNTCVNAKVNGETINVMKEKPLFSSSEKNILPEFDDDRRSIRGSWFTAAYHYLQELLKHLGYKKEDLMFAVHRFQMMTFNREYQLKKLEEKGIKLTDDQFQKIHNAIIYLSINNILDSINTYLENFTANMIYIDPIRYASHRNYIYTNVAVDGISSDGKNVPVYLLSLQRAGLLNRFNEWLHRFFNFTVNVDSTPSTVQILIKEDGKDKRNITDVGYGYSQILPVILAVWDSIFIDRDNETSRRIRRYPRFVIIEQPEVHLHPRMQAQFATMLCKTVQLARERDIDLRVLIETHSETIVNKIGLIVAEKKTINKEDVNVVLFNGKHEGMKDDVSYSTFDENGYLTNWPYGFFDDVD